MKRLSIGVILTVLCLNTAFAQALPKLQNGQKLWSSEDKLTIDDFKIKIGGENNEAVYSQFLLSHAISGFDFLKRNLNQKIRNVFMGNASWIDTTKIDSMDRQLQFQQLQFDLVEVQARKFRRRVLTEKRKVASGFDVVNQIDNDITTEHSELRLKLMKDTESGTNQDKIEEWMKRVAMELKELEEFRFENTKKIKIPR